MPSEPKRKLAAIMFTDMVGYTALMQKDEPRARELIENQRGLLTRLVKKHDGKVLQYVGDGTFCTFNSAIEAVNCAIELQLALSTEEGIALRIGIHVGDVVVKDDEIYGDGVNVASRIEPLSSPGGICISGRVQDDIKNQVEIETIFLGDKRLKNVDKPIEIYALKGEYLSVPMEKKKILIVDDEKNVSDPLQAYLKDKYEVLTENNGLKALETAREFEPHLIILDITFPDTSGGEIASQIQNNHKLKDTPIVFLSGILEKEEEREIAGHQFLSKPVRIEELDECIENYLKSNSEGQ